MTAQTRPPPNQSQRDVMTAQTVPHDGAKVVLRPNTRALQQQQQQQHTPAQPPINSQRAEQPQQDRNTRGGDLTQSKRALRRFQQRQKRSSF
eukprot:3381767-Amphidinium_carterae.1